MDNLAVNYHYHCSIKVSIIKIKLLQKVPLMFNQSKIATVIFGYKNDLIKRFLVMF